MIICQHMLKLTVAGHTAALVGREREREVSEMHRLNPTLRDLLSSLISVC